MATALVPGWEPNPAAASNAHTQYLVSRALSFAEVICHCLTASQCLIHDLRVCSSIDSALCAHKFEHCERHMKELKLVSCMGVNCNNDAN